MELMQHYKIDNYKYMKNKNVFLGCGLQYLTTESLNEVLPYYDAKNKLIITADAIIDNREDLLNEFNLVHNEVGDFSFTIWNQNKQELFCSKDHLGKRTFYYYYDKKSFAFCTVSNPLFCVEGKT